MNIGTVGRGNGVKGRLYSIWRCIGCADVPSGSPAPYRAAG